MAQHHLAFMTSQAAHIESEVFRIRYPDIQYQNLVPIDTSAPPFAGQITYFSMDGYGEAEFLATHGQDWPFVDITQAKHDVRVENLGIGYKYNEFELETAMMLGVNLSSENARVARRVAEEKIDKIVMNGESDLGWDGFMNSNLPTTSDASGSNTAARVWTNKDGQAIADDINNALSGIIIDTLQVEMADTVLLPISALNLIATKKMGDASGTDTTVFEWVMKHNVYTATTGNPLMIRILRGLEKAAANDTGRMIVYRRDPSVLKLHMPMPLRFYAPQQIYLDYCVMGVFRLGGLEIRTPKAIRYIDEIMPTPT